MAGTTADLNNNPVSADMGNEGIVIQKVLDTVPGGATLDVTGFAPTFIPQGHLIIEETSTGKLKPMPISGSTYAALPASHTYKYVNMAGIPTAKPFAGLLRIGSVNWKASTYDMTSILSAVKSAIPLISFNKD